MADVDKLIDLFVEKINASTLELFFEEDVPAFLREGDPDEYGLCKWKVRKKSFLDRVIELEKRLPVRFPDSYRSLISRYLFPAFEIGPIMLFANTGENTFWELSTRLFEDEYMSPFLLQRGFLQFGNPYFYDYDPVCFDSSRPVGREYPIVRIDHEEILCDSTIETVDDISTSFTDFVRDFIDGRISMSR